MIVTTLIAATVAVAEPAPTPPPPAAAPAPAAEKKMDCCEKMKKGGACDCCKDMAAKDGAANHDGHGDHQH